MKGLVLDGGGVFGIGQAIIVKNIDVTKFDFFVGTSIGSANIASVLSGADTINLPSFFYEWMPIIFKSDLYSKLKILSPKYKDANLNESLYRLIGNVNVGDIKKPFFINAINFNDNRLKVFNNIQEEDKSWSLWEVARCSVAAPSYFVPWKNYVDGGVFANNPSMVAVAACCKLLKCPINEVEICSIGTGIFDVNNDGKKMWSVFHWGDWLIKSLLYGSSSNMSDYFVNSLPLKKYLRINFKGEKAWKLDSVSDMKIAEERWKEDINNAIIMVNDFLEK